MRANILQGITVLTLEQVHALPWATSYLADLGARVIRIESKKHLQDRKAGPFPNGKPGDNWWNESGNLSYYGTRNKESLCIDVTQSKGKEIFLKLVESADIVTDNFRPGTMQRFGFDHESLSSINPKIITLSSTAFGYTGPWRRAGSRARTVDAACGLSSLTGYEGGPSLRASNNYMDHSVGNNVAYALLLALYQRRKTGIGMRIDLTMQETGVSAIGPAILEAQRDITRQRLGCSHIWKSPHNVYPTIGDDRWIAISVMSDAEWVNLKRAMDEPDWAKNHTYDTVEGRSESRSRLDEELASWTVSQDNKTLMHHLQTHNVCCAAVYTAEDLLSDSHFDSREFFLTVENKAVPSVGPRQFAGRPFRSSRIPTGIDTVATLGEHNEQILTQLAGYSPEGIADLYEAGVIANKPDADDMQI